MKKHLHHDELHDEERKNGTVKAVENKLLKTFKVNKSKLMISARLPKADYSPPVYSRKAFAKMFKQ